MFTIRSPSPGLESSAQHTGSTVKDDECLSDTAEVMAGGPCEEMQRQGAQEVSPEMQRLRRGSLGQPLVQSSQCIPRKAGHSFLSDAARLRSKSVRQHHSWPLRCLLWEGATGGVSAMEGKQFLDLRGELFSRAGWNLQI